MICFGIIFMALAWPAAPAAPDCCGIQYAMADGTSAATTQPSTTQPSATEPSATEPSATQPGAGMQAATSGVVQGSIHVQGQPLPGEMVVYLEPKNPAAPFPVSAKRERISQKGAQFSPAFAVVSVGQSVEFVNDEDRSVSHNVFSNSPAAAFDLGLFPQGQSRTVAFEKPGAVVLYCSIHKFMDGVVFVCPTPLFSKVDSDGHYKIEGVPPGEYTLKTWQRRRRFPEQSASVKVDATQSLSVDLELRRP